MARFLIKRIIALVFILLGITFITFMMGYFSPSDPIKQAMGAHFNLRTWQQLRHIYGFDQPWYQQYFNVLIHLARFDLGTSFYPQQRAVWDIIKDGVPISLELVTWGTIVALLIGILAGIWSALKANTWVDTLNMGVALVVYALPVFILAIFIQLLILWVNKMGIQWPVTGWGVPWQYTWSDIQYKLAPILTYGASGYAYYARTTRTTMQEVLHQDYIRTARAKGLHERTIVYRHALRNALIPLVTMIGFLIGTSMVGSFFIETIFNIQGLAAITVNSVLQRNYPVIEATTLLVAVSVGIGNLIADILYYIVDPRIRAE
jgi:ABC-type dipeptide/oligopeptide/nickel transport system permease component